MSHLCRKIGTMLSDHISHPALGTYPSMCTYDQYVLDICDRVTPFEIHDPEASPWVAWTTPILGILLVAILISMPIMIGSITRRWAKSRNFGAISQAAITLLASIYVGIPLGCITVNAVLSIQGPTIQLAAAITVAIILVLIHLSRRKAPNAPLSTPPGADLQPVQITLWYVRADDETWTSEIPAERMRLIRRAHESIVTAMPHGALLHESKTAGSVSVTLPLSQHGHIDDIDAAFHAAGYKRDPHAPQPGHDR